MLRQKIVEIYDFQILNPVNNSKDEEIRREKCSYKRKNSSSQKDKKITASAAFNNLDSSEKTFFKRRNLPMVKYVV